MGKKSTRKSEPNAPEFQQILLNPQQPAHNPYYPDLSAYSDYQQQPPPPPYPSLAANTASNYVRMANKSSSRTPAVVIHQQPSTITHNPRYEYLNKKANRFNSGLFLQSLLIICLSVVAYKFSVSRTCINFIIHRPTKDITFSTNDVRDLQNSLAFFSLIALIISLFKCCTKVSKSHSCYFCLVAILTFAATAVSGYVSYLAFYSPCANKLEPLFVNTVRTIVAGVGGNIFAPSDNLWKDLNVLRYAEDDPSGVGVFICDALITLLYGSKFLSALAHL